MLGVAGAAPAAVTRGDSAAASKAGSKAGKRSKSRSKSKRKSAKSKRRSKKGSKKRASGSKVPKLVFPAPESGELLVVRTAFASEKSDKASKTKRSKAKRKGSRSKSRSKKPKKPRSKKPKRSRGKASRRAPSSRARRKGGGSRKRRSKKPKKRSGLGAASTKHLELSRVSKLTRGTRVVTVVSKSKSRSERVTYTLAYLPAHSKRTGVSKLKLGWEGMKPVAKGARLYDHDLTGPPSQSVPSEVCDGVDRSVLTIAELAGKPAFTASGTPYFKGIGRATPLAGEVDALLGAACGYGASGDKPASGKPSEPTEKGGGDAPAAPAPSGGGDPDDDAAPGGGDSSDDDGSVVLRPKNTTLPSITGALSPGEDLTCNKGSWENAPDSFGYAWYRNDALIGGANGAVFTTLGTDGGKSFKCKVTATNEAGSGEATSAAVTFAGEGEPDPDPDTWFPPNPQCPQAANNNPIDLCWVKGNEQDSGKHRIWLYFTPTAAQSDLDPIDTIHMSDLMANATYVTRAVPEGWGWNCDWSGGGQFTCTKGSGSLNTGQQYAFMFDVDFDPAEDRMFLLAFQKPGLLQGFPETVWSPEAALDSATYGTCVQTAGGPADPLPCGS